MQLLFGTLVTSHVRKANWALVHATGNLVGLLAAVGNKS
jgi:hypothetical protein